VAHGIMQRFKTMFKDRQTFFEEREAISMRPRATGTETRLRAVGMKPLVNAYACMAAGLPFAGLNAGEGGETDAYVCGKLAKAEVVLRAFVS